jgi:hypothetical protein
MNEITFEIKTYQESDLKEGMRVQFAYEYDNLWQDGYEGATWGIITKIDKIPRRTFKIQPENDSLFCGVPVWRSLNEQGILSNCNRNK